MAKRETFYDCVFSSDRNEYIFHIRAWSAEGAAAALRDELRAHGLEAAGTIEVRDPRGRTVLRASYGPGGEQAVP